MSATQHREAHRLLSLLADRRARSSWLTYSSAAAALGRDPKTNARMIAQVCDLLDAAAAIANTPLLALVAVREASNEINRKAWVKGVPAELRERIIQRSLSYQFRPKDFVAIRRALSELEGLGNRAAWEHFRKMYPQKDERYRILGGEAIEGAGRSIGANPRAIVEALIPREHRFEVLSSLAQSIEIAHASGPTKWGLRLKRTNIMLKVGFVEVFQVGKGWFHELVKTDLVPKVINRDARVRFSRAPYVNAPGCDVFDAEISIFRHVYRKVTRAHSDAIQVAARSQRHTSTARDHSEQLVIFLSHLLGRTLPQPMYEVSPTERAYREGAAIQVLTTKYERDPAARRRCIEHYGTECFVCRLKMSDRYGPPVEGLIHVHHLQQIATIGRSQRIDPVRDLRPVCPNCHAVIHSTTPPRTIEDVQLWLERRRSG